MLDTSTFKFKVILIANAVFYSKCACLIDEAAKILNCSAARGTVFCFQNYGALRTLRKFFSVTRLNISFLRLNCLGCASWI